LGDAIERGCGHHTAERAGHTEACVIRHDQQNVWRTFWWNNARSPARFRFASIALDRPAEGAEAGGNCLSDLSDSVAAGEQGSGVDCCANPPLAAKVASNKPARAMRSNCAIYVLGVSPLLNDFLRSLYSYLSVTPESETHGFSRVLPSLTHTEFAPLSWCRAVPEAQLRILPLPTEFVLSCSAGPIRRESLSIANRTHSQNPQSASARACADW